MSLVYLPQETTPVQKDALWALTWAGDRLVSGGADGIVRLHDPADLALPLNELPALPLAVGSLTSTRDGKWALAASLDGTAALVNVGRGRLSSKVETGREGVAPGESELAAYAAAIHPTAACWAWTGRGSKLAIRSIDTAALEAADAETQDEDGEQATQAGPSNALSGSGSVVDTVKGKFGMAVEFSPDGTQVAVGLETGHVVVADVETKSVVATYSAHAMTVRSLAWSPDSQWLYTGADDARIVLHDVRAGSTSGAKGEGAVAIMQGHNGWVLSMAASPDGRLLGSGGADSTVKLWDVGQRSCVSTNNLDAEVWGFAWQAEYEGSLAPGKQFAVAGDDKKVTLFRAAGAV